MHECKDLVVTCSQDWESRDEDDMIIIERILLLIRNILHIPTEASEEQVCVSLSCLVYMRLSVCVVHINYIIGCYSVLMMMSVFMIK